MTESWLPVIGYEGIYEVSDHGRVRSLDRSSFDSRGRKRSKRGKVLANTLGGNGYAYVGLSKSGVVKCFTVHSLVLRAFQGSPRSDQECRHLDGDRFNPRLENLAWGTSQENTQDSVEHGTHYTRPVMRGDGVRFQSITEAADSVNGNFRNVQAVCKGRRKTAYGHSWSYI